MTNARPLLVMENISKSYPGVKALDKVNLQLRAGEVHCLVGENGAGKSTLIKILTGYTQNDSGKIFINGQEVHIHNPDEGLRLGIAALYQEQLLVPHLTVAENIFLGCEPLKPNGDIDWKAMRNKAVELIKSLDLNLAADDVVKDLSIPERQFVVMLRAFSQERKILIFDEPSTVFSGKELELLFDSILRLKEKGLGIIYISHRLEEVFQIGDRITVLRDGQYIKTMNATDTNKDELVRLMVGRVLTDLYQKQFFNNENAETVLKVDKLTKDGLFSNISFSLHKGEIIGFAGLEGSRRTEVIKAIAGAQSIDSGSIELKGVKTKINSPQMAREMGIGLVPKDRNGEGLILCRPISENIGLTFVQQYKKFFWLDFTNWFLKIMQHVKELGIKTQTIERTVSTLSGGNRQKVVLAKWLATGCKVLILDEPTRGVDIGAKQEIYSLIESLVKQGLSIIIISSELPELLGLSDRILVMSEGKIRKELNPKETTQEEILKYCLPVA